MHILLSALFNTDDGADKLYRYFRDNPDASIDLGRAVTARRHADGTLDTTHYHSLASGGAAIGVFWGGVLGFLFLNPLLGALAGAGIGTEIGTASESLIHPIFLRELADQLVPGTSGFFLAVREKDAAKAEEALKKKDCTVLRALFTPEGEKAMENLMKQNDIIKNATTNGQDSRS